MDGGRIEADELFETNWGVFFSPFEPIARRKAPREKDTVLAPRRWRCASHYPLKLIYDVSMKLHRPLRGVHRFSV